MLLTDRTFGPWFWGNLASNSGSWLFNVTAVVVVFDISGSALLVGLVSVAQFAGLAVLSPWAGALADKFDRRTVLLSGQTVAAVSAFVIAAVTLSVGVNGLPGAWPVLLAALGIGVGKAVAGPSASSLVPALVNDADLESAVALTQLTFNVGRAIGPIGAGVLLVTLGPPVAFAINAVSFLVLIGALLIIRERPREAELHRDGSVMGGIRYAWSDRATLSLLIAAATAGIAADPAITLAPPLAEVLSRGDGLVASIMSSFGICATVGALVSGRLQRAIGSLPMGGAGMSLMAAGLLIVIAGPTAAWLVTGFGVAGGGYSFAITSFTAGLQRRVPDELRGRVMALWGVAFLGSRPLAAIVHGGISDGLGPRVATVVAVGVSLLGVGLAVRLHSRSTV